MDVLENGGFPASGTISSRLLCHGGYWKHGRASEILVWARDSLHQRRSNSEELGLDGRCREKEQERGRE
jgi:hypothetical protein